MAELKECDVGLLENRLKNLTASIEAMEDDYDVRTTKKFMENVRDYMAQLLCLLRRPAPENKPLTPHELRQMDGEPVWVVPLTPMIDEFKPHWCIMRSEATAMSEASKGKMWFLHLCDYGKTWIAYRRKPEGV